MGSQQGEHFDQSTTQEIQNRKHQLFWQQQQQQQQPVFLQTSSI